jgi:hypothetical protein
MLTGVPIPPPAERRIRREARSETLRERALALRQAGWTLARIGQALGVSTTRVYQMVRKAERLIADALPDNEASAPVRERPCDVSDDPPPADRNKATTPCLYKMTQS